MLGTISSLVALVYVSTDIRLLYLTWGYLRYQEVKIHVTILRKLSTVVEGYQQLCNKSQWEGAEGPCTTTLLPLSGQWLTIIWLVIV